MNTPNPSPAAVAPAPSPPPVAQVERRKAGRRTVLDAIAGQYRFVPVVLMLGVIWAFFASQNSAFLGSRNLTSLLVQIVVTAVIALGIVFVLLLAEIDLSVAANSGASATLTAILVVNHHWSAWLGLLAGIAAGAAVGLVQGAIVTQFGVPSFVVTLGAQLALLGAILVLLPGGTGQVSLFGTGIATLSSTFLSPALGWAFAAIGVAAFVLLRWLAAGESRRRGMDVSLVRTVVVPGAVVGAVGLAAVAVLNSYLGVPLPVVILFTLLAVFSYLTSQTRFGLHLYAVGANPDAARRAGIPVARVKMIAFSLAGGLAALGGILAASRLLGVSASSGTGTVLLESIAAAVIGGTSLFGGRGSVWDALLGALVIGSISNGLDLIGAQTVVKYVAEGSILVLAATVDSVLTRGSLFARATK
ncbi:sugar ABC transporter permease [Streptomyces sp. NBC_01262]|uniref:sugar ABC transporter permease n=1 Tax=Streptomyces sp. NBC_01262 TaxID=2903803 RepID=UPI002E381436|nr:inner-membrane translocator [Streptomyces sp. NBC_01262]